MVIPEKSVVFAGMSATSFVLPLTGQSFAAAASGGLHCRPGKTLMQ